MGIIHTGGIKRPIQPVCSYYVFLDIERSLGFGCKPSASLDGLRVAVLGEETAHILEITSGGAQSALENRCKILHDQVGVYRGESCCSKPIWRWACGRCDLHGELLLYERAFIVGGFGSRVKVVGERNTDGEVISAAMFVASLEEDVDVDSLRYDSVRSGPVANLASKSPGCGLFGRPLSFHEATARDRLGLISGYPFSRSRQEEHRS